MDGVSLVRRVYKRLRGPSQQALPYQTVLETVGEVVARKKLDLALSQQNSLATVSEWFTPSESDFSLEELGVSVLLPVRVETRAVGSEYETGDQVPIVSMEVLDTSQVGAVSFYGDPLRMAFRDNTDYVTEQEYRIVYESDLEGENSLEGTVGLPEYFKSIVVLEACWKLIDQIDDESPEFKDFYKMVAKKWESEIIDERIVWEKYVRSFKGRAVVPKRTFFDNRDRRTRTRYFRG